VSEKAPNKLYKSNSPYLLQHAFNPVDWHEWSDEAFNIAREQNKLVFLSIGYSTCHWCHVMEHESFEDIDVAAILNSAFVAIKVDREQRPDIDMIYMDVCQALTGSGGWPLTLILTPEQKPVFAGTYFPKRQKYGRPGLMEILAAINAAWQTEPQKLIDSAEKITGYFLPERSEGGRFPAEELVKSGAAAIENDYDEEYGGFSMAPKFPMGHVLSFLLHCSLQNSNDDLLNKVKTTLKRMYMGGIHDHIGGGFCRYSTDEKWLVPHFEKMLYDNALLLEVYADAWKLTGENLFKVSAESISSYVMRDLRSDKGAFYSAEDADSEGHEGRFYVFSKDEFARLAGDEADLLADFLGVSEKGNFENATSIIHLRASAKDFCLKKSLDPQCFKEKVDNLRQKLFSYREKRVRPSLDDKVIVSWNGLMIGALAKSGRIFHRSDLVEAAEKAAEFVRKNLCDEHCNLKRYWRKGRGDGSGFFEDYAFLIRGLLELYRSNYDAVILEWAIQLAESVIEKFAGRMPGEYYESPVDSEKLIFRPKNRHDGALPSARAVFADACVSMHVLTEKQKYADLAAAIFADGAALMARVPSATAMLLNAMRRFYRRPDRVLITGEKIQDAESLVSVTDCALAENCLIVSLSEKDRQILAPLLENPGQLDSNTRVKAVVCTGNSCLPPVFDAENLARVLNRIF